MNTSPTISVPSWALERQTPAHFSHFQRKLLRPYQPEHAWSCLRKLLLPLTMLDTFFFFFHTFIVLSTSLQSTSCNLMNTTICIIICLTSTFSQRLQISQKNGPPFGLLLYTFPQHSKPHIVDTPTLLSREERTMRWSMSNGFHKSRRLS